MVHYKQGDSLLDQQTFRVVRGCRVTEATQNPIGMQGRKCRSSNLWCKEVEKKKLKQQYINGPDNMLLKVCITLDDRNYSYKPSDRSDSGSAWNSLRSLRLLASHVSPLQLSKLPCDQNQTRVNFCSYLQRSCDGKHACSSNIPGTTNEWCAHYNSQLYTRSACQ
ncbi:hypothetical protein TNCV_5106521 [Trichonephila clavipes]|nr:hypothetical protein TNCV_5106521 [Trichonephila clavipes]